jgi:hypothetical protein
LERGSGSFGIVASLVVVGLILFLFSIMMKETVSPNGGLAVAAVSQDAACALNRQTLQASLLTYSVRNDGSSLTLGEAQRQGIRVPECPEKGQYSLDGKEVVCSVHSGGSAQFTDRTGFSRMAEKPEGETSSKEKSSGEVDWYELLGEDKAGKKAGEKGDVGNEKDSDRSNSQKR